MINENDMPNDMQNDIVRSWKAYTAEGTGDASPVQSIMLDDDVFGGVNYPMPTHYPCTVFETWCYGGCTAACGT